MRLILFALLAAAAGLQITAHEQQQQQPSNVLGLKRFVDRVRVGDIAAAPVATTTVGCTGVDCAHRSITREARILDEVHQENADEDEEGDDEEDETGLEEGRGKKGKKKKGYGKMMMVLAGFTKAIMLYFMIHAVAALAGKALIVAKIALAIAVAVALKKSGEHKTSYEIVKHPQYSSVHTHSSSVDYDHGGGGSSSYDRGDGVTRRRRGLSR